MMLSDRRLEYIFQQLRAIPHVEIIRLGSRITSHLPERITPEFCEMVQKYHPDLHEHALQPPERADARPRSRRSTGWPTPASRSAARRCCCKGVNDDPKVMMKLMHELLKARVRPYYIYMADQVAGGEHFRTTVAEGSRDHEGAARLDVRPRRSALRDRRAGRRRQGAAPARVRRGDQRRRSDLPQLRGQALRLQAAAATTVPTWRRASPPKRTTSCRSRRARRRRRDARHDGGSQRTAERGHRATSRSGPRRAATRARGAR